MDAASPTTTPAPPLAIPADVNTFMVFDTETTGLPCKDPHTNGRYFHQPWLFHKYDGARLVQIAWTLIDSAGNELSRSCFLIRPDGFTIPPESTAVHHISHARAREQGVSVGDVLMHDFARDLRRADMLVAHNITFDRLIVMSELYRLRHRMDYQAGDGQEESLGACDRDTVTGVIDEMRGKRRFDTMREGRRHFLLGKWPKLADLHAMLHPRRRPLGAEQLHDAAVDTQAAADCFVELALAPRHRAQRLATLRPRASLSKPARLTYGRRA